MRGRSNSGCDLPEFRGGSGAGERSRKREKMGWGRKSPLAVALSVGMVLGFVVYFRIWVLDYRISSDEAELIRRQFDIAHKEAVDESAEWRLRFDEEREKGGDCIRELDQVKTSSGKKSGNREVDRRVETLEKEKLDLVERIEALKQELETEKFKCGLQ